MDLEDHHQYLETMEDHHQDMEDHHQHLEAMEDHHQDMETMEEEDLEDHREDHPEAGAGRSYII